MNPLPQMIASYSSMFRNWGKLVTGESYWHMRQGPGTQFISGELAGYFNDLTGKVRWQGESDGAGMPLVRIGSRLRRFPTVILQKALGHWDLWLSSARNDDAHRSAFMALADWTCSSQDARGGWLVPSLDKGLISPYSAMVQGEAISVLVRAYSVTYRSAYLQAADKAASLMLRSTTDNGTARLTSDGIILEEYPSSPPKTVLNGWIFALYGLYDLLLVSADGERRSALQSTLGALIRHLPQYDALYWSKYDDAGTIASPFYHELHIAQLRTMQVTFPEHTVTIGDFVSRLESYAASRYSLVHAVIVKGCQKLLRPPKTAVN